MKYIGIDVGSSFIKSAIIDLDRSCVVERNRFSAPEKLNLPDEKKFEIPASSFVETVRSLIDTATAKYHDMEGVLLSTQMHGFVYRVPSRMDTYISWQDMRCLNTAKDTGLCYMDLLKERIPREEMEASGIFIKPSLGFCNLFALIDEKDIPADGTLYTLGSYLIFRFTGNNICHIMNAAPWGLVNLVRRSWNRALIEKLGLSKIKFPTIAEKDFEPCGFYESNEQRLKVFPDYGDQQISILGSLPKKEDVVLNIATAGQVSVVRDRFETGDYEVRPYFEGLYINTVSNMPAGRGLDVLIHFIQHCVQAVIGKRPAASQVWKAVQSGFHFDCKGICVDTAFYTTPDHRVGGNIAHIGPENLTLGSLFSAAFADIGQTYWQSVKILCGDRRVNRLVCAGGVSWKTPELLDVIEKITRIPCTLSPVSDEALLGLFRTALVCTRICQNLKETEQKKLQDEGSN